jgi:mRNA-degrading endonuclease RelE of RelBE toxin-antitoxin system
MDKIEKFLRKLGKQDRATIATLISFIVSDNTARLDIKKLKGYQDIFRIRSGKIRIIYRKTTQDIEVLSISYRNDKTYRKF